MIHTYKASATECELHVSPHRLATVNYEKELGKAFVIALNQLSVCRNRDVGTKYHTSWDIDPNAEIPYTASATGPGVIISWHRVIIDEPVSVDK